MSGSFSGSFRSARTFELWLGRSGPVCFAAALLLACGGEDGDPSGGGGLTSIGGIDQPPIRAAAGDGSLGTDLGEVPVVGQTPTRIVQAVAGRAFVCALDDAGAVWCWGDRRPHWLEATAGRTWPVLPERVKNAPPLGSLLVPVALSDGSAPGVFDGACGLDASARWWCWGIHPLAPIQDRLDLLVAALVSDAGRPAIPDIPPALSAEIDPLGGFAYLGVSTCAVRSAGGLVCWPGTTDTTADRIDGFPRGTKLAGRCALTPDGAVRCSVPFDTAQGCELGLTSLQGTDTRVCGQRADGEWRCVGRPVGSGAVELPGLRDVVMPGCE